MPKKLTLEEMKLMAESLNGKCLSSEYVNNKTKMKWECNICGHQWEAAPKSVKRGSWCPYCAKRKKSASRAGKFNKRLTITEMQALARQNNGECLSNEYINNKTKLLWKCSEGHTWTARPDKIKLGQWCPYCAGKYQQISDMKEIARKRGGECLSGKYIDNTTKLKWICIKGHRWEATPKSVKMGRWCPECAIERRRKD